ncbi:MAG: geranylgeranylglyceryl/heptaprenylglyceryl phosphate synthase [Psychroserpens sp.]|nr:geranylgeranylglyceryl/heptaprenylglyceryl phosphate synthase [Psychroserpens sp.]
METILEQIKMSSGHGEKLLAVLVDPDKLNSEAVSPFFQKVNQSVATHIFVGGSTVADEVTDQLVAVIKHNTDLPVIIFPGDVTQISNKADALLFLSLISGDNPEYLIGKQIKAVKKLKGIDLEVIPTGYILIENGKPTAVELVTKTAPISRQDLDLIVDTAKAGEYLGLQLIYLEAGSGALHPVTEEIISKVKRALNIPVIVGGGIRSKSQMDSAFHAGADMVVIGTAFEKDASFFEDLKQW